jgi:uncharacterized membrane protein
MKRFILAAVVGSLRRALAVVIALVALAGAIYFAGHKLSNPDHYQYGGCPWYGVVSHGFPRSCSPPTRATRQIPLAVAIAVFGLGAAVAVTERRRV